MQVGPVFADLDHILITHTLLSVMECLVVAFSCLLICDATQLDRWSNHRYTSSCTSPQASDVAPAGLTLSFYRECPILYDTM